MDAEELAQFEDEWMKGEDNAPVVKAKSRAQIAAEEGAANQQKEYSEGWKQGESDTSFDGALARAKASGASDFEWNGKRHSAGLSNDRSGDPAMTQTRTQTRTRARAGGGMGQGGGQGANLNSIVEGMAKPHPAITAAAARPAAAPVASPRMPASVVGKTSSAAALADQKMAGMGSAPAAPVMRGAKS